MGSDPKSHLLIEDVVQWELSSWVLCFPASLRIWQICSPVSLLGGEEWGRCSIWYWGVMWGSEGTCDRGIAHFLLLSSTFFSWLLVESLWEEKKREDRNFHISLCSGGLLNKLKINSKRVSVFLVRNQLTTLSPKWKKKLKNTKVICLWWKWYFLEKLVCDKFELISIMSISRELLRLFGRNSQKWISVSKHFSKNYKRTYPRP